MTVGGKKKKGITCVCRWRERGGPGFFFTFAAREKRKGFPDVFWGERTVASSLNLGSKKKRNLDLRCRRGLRSFAGSGVKKRRGNGGVFLGKGGKKGRTLL